MIEIEIAIGIEIARFGVINCRIFPNGVSSAAQPAQHRRDAIQVLLAILVLVLLQGIANPQHILNRRTFQRRPAGDLKIAAPVGFGGLAVPLGDIQRDRLARSQPLVPGMAMNSGQFNGLRENLGDVVNRETGDIKFFVSE